VDQSGHAERLGRAVRTRPSVTSALVSQGQRFSFNSPPRRDWTLTGDGEEMWRVDMATGAMLGVKMKRSSRILAAAERRVVSATRDERNGLALALDGEPPMIQLNNRLSEIAFAPAEAVTH